MNCRPLASQVAWWFTDELKLITPYPLIQKLWSALLNCWKWRKNPKAGIEFFQITISWWRLDSLKDADFRYLNWCIGFFLAAFLNKCLLPLNMFKHLELREHVWAWRIKIQWLVTVRWIKIPYKYIYVLNNPPIWYFSTLLLAVKNLRAAPSGFLLSRSKV